VNKRYAWPPKGKTLIMIYKADDQSVKKAIDQCADVGFLYVKDMMDLGISSELIID